METFISAATITLAAAVTVALWTFRIALANRGRRALSATIASCEAVLFALIFTGLVTNLGDPIRLVAYALGVATGTWLGLVADERLSSGQSEVRWVVPGGGAEVVAMLHAAGWPATSTPALGPSGAATTVFVAVDDRRVAAVPAAPVADQDPAGVEPSDADRDIGIRDLRLASAELGEALAHTPELTDAVARAIAGWLTDVGAGLGREVSDLSPTSVLLARAHGVVGRASLSASYVPEAAELATRARGLSHVLRRAEQGG